MRDGGGATWTTALRMKRQEWIQDADSTCEG